MSHKNLECFCLLLLIGLSSIHALERHMICKDVQDVFSPVPSHSQSTSEITKLQGKPGKRGPKGPQGPKGAKGARGPPGEAGAIDYPKIELLVQEKIDGEIAKVLQRVESMERWFERTYCHVKHDGKCYYVNFERMDYNRAKQECTQLGAEVANIYSKEQYDKLTSYIRLVFPTGSYYIEPWLGMTYNIAEKKVYLRDSTTTAPYMIWYPGYPVATKAYTQINLQVRPDPNTSPQNMWNYDPTKARDGVICEF